MTEPRTCSRCGAELPPDAPGGHCLQCLLQLGLQPDDTSAERVEAGILPASEGGSLPPGSLLAEKPGDRIGHFKLLQQIGEGGCGIVYMAEQEQPVRRRVALKIIKLGMDTRNVIARFEAERQALAMMDHPNIAKVLDAGATPTGRPYFVMELVRGVKITTYCDQQKLSTRQRLDLFIQVCQAIQHAHQKGIIHRDLKPSNILVTEQDGAPVPKIIDFGIAKATTDQRLTDKTLFTAFEQFIGTPAYMSPEQAGLGGLDIDTRSDIYSLGVLLYELLTGKPPFDAEQLARSALDEILRVIRENEPQRPSARLTTLTEQELTTVAQRRQIESAKLPNLVRGDLDWIVMKALDKDRSRRYDTANSFARDLQRFLDNEAVIACPPSNLYRFQKLVRRNRLGFAAAAAVAAALLIGFSVSTWMYIRESQAKREQARLRQNAQTEAAKSEQVAKFLQDMLEGIGPSVALGRDTKLLREILDKTAERVSKDLTNRPEVEADLRLTIGRVYQELGDYPKAEEMLRPAVPLFRKLGSRRSGNLINSLRSLSASLEREGKWAEAEALAREALDLTKKKSGNEHKNVAAALTDLANVLDAQGKLTEAETLDREALAMNKKFLSNDHRTVANSLNNLAGVLQDQGKLTEAESMHREALAMRTKLLSNEHPDVAMSLQNLAVTLRDQGKLAEAETTVRDALALYRKMLGDEHPVTAQALKVLGDVLDGRGKLVEAEAKYREALTVRRKLWPDGHRDVASALDHLAVALCKQSKFTEAESMYREALAMRQKLVGDEHPEVAGSLGELANLREDQGKLVESENLHRQALEMMKKLLTNGPSLAPSSLNNLTRELNNLAGVLMKQKRLDEAETNMREALAIQRELLGDQHTHVAMQLDNLGYALKEQGKLAEAETMYRQAFEMLKKLRGNTHPSVAGSLRNLAGILVSEHKYDDAEQLFNDILTPAVASQPQSADLLTERAKLRGRTGRWREAATDFSKLIEFKPEDHLSYYKLAPLLVQTGELDAYRELCRKSAERFGNTNDMPSARRTAKLCLILPSSGVDPETVTRMADTAVATGANHKDLTLIQCTKGWDEYRRGRFASAVEWTQKAVASGQTPYSNAEAYLIMAMAHQQLGQTPEARAALAKGIQIADTDLPKFDSADLGDTWVDVIIVHVLMGEAKTLIEGQSSTTSGP